MSRTQSMGDTPGLAARSPAGLQRPSTPSVATTRGLLSSSSAHLLRIGTPSLSRHTSTATRDVPATPDSTAGVRQGSMGRRVSSSGSEDLRPLYHKGAAPASSWNAMRARYCSSDGGESLRSLSNAPSRKALGPPGHLGSLGRRDPALAAAADAAATIGVVLRDEPGTGSILATAAHTVHGTLDSESEALAASSGAGPSRSDAEAARQRQQRSGAGSNAVPQRQWSAKEFLLQQLASGTSSKALVRPGAVPRSVSGPTGRQRGTVVAAAPAAPAGRTGGPATPRATAAATGGPSKKLPGATGAAAGTAAAARRSTRASDSELLGGRRPGSRVTPASALPAAAPLPSAAGRALARGALTTAPQPKAQQQEQPREQQVTGQQQQAQQRDRRGSDTQELLSRLRSANSALAAVRSTSLGRLADGGSGDRPGSRRTAAAACAEGVEHSALRSTGDSLPQPPNAPLPPPPPPPPLLPPVSEITDSPQELSPPEGFSPPPPALSRDNSGRKGQGGGSLWSSLVAVAESAARALGGTTVAAAGRLSPTSPSPTSRDQGVGSQHNGRSLSGPPGIGGGPDSGSVLLPPMPTLIPSLGGGRLQVLVEESGVSLDEHMIGSTNAPPPPPTGIGSGYARRSSQPHAFVPSLRRSLSPPHRSDAYGEAAAAAASAIGEGPPPVPFRTGQGGYGYTPGAGPSSAYAGSAGWGAPLRPSNSAAGLPDFYTASGESDSDGYSYSMRRLSSQGSRKIRGILKSGSMSAVSPVPQAPQPIVWVTNGRGGGGRASSSDGSGVFLRATFSGGSGTSTPVRPAYQHRALPGVPPPPTAYPSLPTAAAAAGSGVGGAFGGGAGMSRAQGFAAGLRIQLPPDEANGPGPRSGNTSPLQAAVPTPSSAGSMLSPGSLPTPRHPPPYRGTSFNRRVSFTPDVSDSESRPHTQNAARSMSGPPVLPASGEPSAPSPTPLPPGSRPSAYLTLMRTGSGGSTSSVGGAAPGWAHQSSMERRQARRPPQLEKIPSLPGSPSAPGSPSHGPEPPLAPRGTAVARRLDSFRSLVSVSSTGRPRSRKPGMVPTYSTVIKILVSYAQVRNAAQRVSLQAICIFGCPLCNIGISFNLLTVPGHVPPTSLHLPGHVPPTCLHLPPFYHRCCPSCARCPCSCPAPSASSWQSPTPCRTACPPSCRWTARWTPPPPCPSACSAPSCPWPCRPCWP